MTTQISDPAVEINNEGIKIVPNSFKFTEGQGEQEVLTESAGNGNVDQVYADNAETKIGGFMFSMRATLANIKLAREWKTSRNTNSASVTSILPEGNLTRRFANAALVNDYEVNLTSDGVLELEFKAKAPTI